MDPFEITGGKSHINRLRVALEHYVPTGGGLYQSGRDGPCRVTLEYGVADEVILYDDFDSKVRALTGGRGVDVAYDHVGRPTFDRGMNCLARRAWFVYFGMTARSAPPPCARAGMRGPF